MGRELSSGAGCAGLMQVNHSLACDALSWLQVLTEAHGPISSETMLARMCDNLLHVTEVLICQASVHLCDEPNP